MGLLNRDKNKGLSEQQRLQQALFERKIKESKDKLITNLPAFREGYRDLVIRTGIKFIPVVEFNKTRGLYPIMVEQECSEEVEAFRKAEEKELEVQTTQGDGVVKN
jgi:hypothetical protein